MRDRRVAPDARVVALLGAVGAWVGHALEYARVGGGAGLVDGVLSPVHRPYVLPLGVALAAVLAVLARRTTRRWVALASRLEQMRADLRGRWRNSFHARRRAPGPAVRRTAGWAQLTATLAAIQIVIYAVQENVEASIAGRPAPLAEVASGVHALAPLVHLAVAAVLAAALVAIRRRERARASCLVRVARLLSAFARADTTVAVPRTSRVAPPAQRFGSVLWGRAPPSPAAG